MINLIKIVSLYALLGFASVVWAEPELAFTLHKHESGVPGPTLLVIGGIQGDEPGGFTAASLLVTDYKITSGSVWVVPNLNFLSIIKRSRGVYGDMNRKFLRLRDNDPEYSAIEKIKSIILDKKVDLILNLHDGSGFFRPVHHDALHSPLRWGQSVIIDQRSIEASKFGELEAIAQDVSHKVNASLENLDSHYYVRNTRTREGDVEMEKTLTYYAIRHNKPAFGVEASKSFLTHQRSFNHLHVVEEFMRSMGIGFERQFPLTLPETRQRIDANIQLSLYDRRLFFDMTDVRPRLSYIPMQKGAPLHFLGSNPLMAVINEKNSYQVRYGNRQITYLTPQYFEYDQSLQVLPMMIDGREHQVEIGSLVDVDDVFSVLPPAGYRVNVIGYYRRGIDNEAATPIRLGDMLPRFSVDNKARAFRVELYRNAQFCGMVLVRFRQGALAHGGGHIDGEG